MNQEQRWLPDLVLLEDSNGDWVRYIECIYQYFHKDFIESLPVYEQKRWAMKRLPTKYNKEATFWHIITEGSNESERTPNLRRCERIRWPRAIIDAVSMKSVKLWKNKRGNEERIILALPDFSYIVILADRGEYILLWTAYCVEHKHQRQKLEKEYYDYKKG